MSAVRLLPRLPQRDKDGVQAVTRWSIAGVVHAYTCLLVVITNTFTLGWALGAGHPPAWDAVTAYGGLAAITGTWLWERRDARKESC